MYNHSGVFCINFWEAHYSIWKIVLDLLPWGDNYFPVHYIMLF